MKRFTYFIIPVLGIAGVIVFGYLTRYKPGISEQNGGVGSLPSVLPAGTPNYGQGAGGDNGTSTSGQYLGQKFGIVSQVAAADYFVDAANNLTIVEPAGEIVKISPTGEQTTLSSAPIQKLVKASFSYDGKKVLALFGDPSEPQASVFDTLEKAWQPLPSTALFPSWSPSSYAVVYFDKKSGGAVLTTLDTSKTKARPVEWLILHEEDLVPQWVSQNQILISEKPSAQTIGSLWLFDMKKDLLSPVARKLRGLESAWSGTAGEGMLFKSNGGLGGGDILIDANGTTLRDFSIMTLPSKCVFGEKTVPIATSTEATATPKAKSAATSTQMSVLDCAVPRDAGKFNSYALPDAYEKQQFYTADNFYEINLATGDMQTIWNDDAQIVDAKDLRMYNDTLFFINRLNQKVYAISLK